MTGTKKHIAAFVIAIFFFPIAFQSLHIVWHHSHDGKCERPVFLQKTFDAESAVNKKNISANKDACPICDYQFSILDVPEIACFSSVIPANARIRNEIATPQQYQHFFSDKTPRAPPVVIS